MASMHTVTLSFKGKSLSLPLDLESPTLELLFDEALSAFGLSPAETAIKLILKGKQLRRDADAASQGLRHGAKLMVMATERADASAIDSTKADRTIRGFEEEDAAARWRQEDAAGERSEWVTPQAKEYKFARFEACTWHSFGVRPTSKTPHAFEARKLLLKLATDPGIVSIMEERQWVVGTLAEMDPIDDRLKEKIEGSGHTRLLGYNTNSGMRIDLRLRTTSLDDFEPYSSIVDTLLHELAHNEIGPHNAMFWNLFAQLKADYLRTHARLGRRGTFISGRSPAQVAGVEQQILNVKDACLAAVARDSMMPINPAQAEVLDRYLSLTDNTKEAAAAVGGRNCGGMPTSREALRHLMAERAAARRGDDEGTAAESRRPAPDEPASQADTPSRRGGNQST